MKVTLGERGIKITDQLSIFVAVSVVLLGKPKERKKEGDREGGKPSLYTNENPIT